MTECRIAIAGLGVVGAKTAQLLLEHQESYSQKAGCPLTLTAVSARSKDKDRGFDMSSLAWYDDPVDMASQDNIDVIVELMGGSDGPALALTKAALSSGKHVVTANKAMIAKHGKELAQLAEAANTQLVFEAAVAGGIPALKMLREGLSANQITAVSGILNGTCNYILSTMEQTGRAFDDVLAEAQALGYAEADPTFDVEGIDAAHKLAILASIAYGTAPSIDAISVTGITAITDKDITYASELGYRIRLIGRAPAGGNPTVQPCLLPLGSPLASVTGPTNAVYYEADPVETISAMGPGAGAGPTASAVLADIIDIASGRGSFAFAVPADTLSEQAEGADDEAKSGYYLRLQVSDESGVLAEVTEALTAHQMSIETLIQKPLSQDNMADLVMILHDTDKASMARAADALTTIEAVQALSSSLVVLK